MFSMVAWSSPAFVKGSVNKISFLYSNENPVFKHILELNTWFIEENERQKRSYTLPSSGTGEILMGPNSDAEASS